MNPLIDCDTHPMVARTSELFEYMPSAWAERFRMAGIELVGSPKGRYQHPNGPMRLDATPPDGGPAGSDRDYFTKDHLEQYGVSASILLPMQLLALASWVEPLSTTVMTNALNRYFLEHWVEVDSRYKLALGVAAQDPVRSVETIREFGNRQGIVGILVPLQAILMGHQHYDPIYEIACELGLPILVHPTSAEGLFHGAPPYAGGIPARMPEKHALNPQFAMSNISSLVFSGTFQRFPELQVIFVEYGFSWLPTFAWRLDKEWRNFRIDVPWIETSPIEIVRNHCRFTTQPIDEPPDLEYLWHIMSWMGAEDTLLFSSDYPHYDTDNPQMIMSKFVPKGIRTQVAHANAEAAFNGRV